MKPTINVSANNEFAFRRSCHYGQLEVAQWLRSLDPFKYNVEKCEVNTVKNKELTGLLYLLIASGNEHVLHADVVDAINKYIDDK